MDKLHTKREQLSTVIERKCRYLGHVARNNNKYELLQIILEGKIEGKWRPGKRKITWMGNIKNWLDMTTAQIIHTMHDKERIGQIVADAIRQH